MQSVAQLEIPPLLQPDDASSERNSLAKLALPAADLLPSSMVVPLMEHPQKLIQCLKPLLPLKRMGW